MKKFLFVYEWVNSSCENVVSNSFVQLDYLWEQDVMNWTEEKKLDLKTYKLTILNIIPLEG